MRTLKLTDEETQLVMSIIREQRNLADDKGRVYRAKQNGTHARAEWLKYYDDRSRVLTAVMVKIYGAIDGSD